MPSLIFLFKKKFVKYNILYFITKYLIFLLNFIDKATKILSQATNTTKILCKKIINKYKLCKNNK